MSRLFLFASLSIVFAVGAMVAGCSNQPVSDQPDAAQVESASTGQENHQDHDHEGSAPAGHDMSAHAKQSAHAKHAEDGGNGQYAEALAKLSVADRALAEKQEVCPVTGQPLGSMGTPYKVTVQGQAVLLCCPGCESKIKENPEKYLAKLSE